MIRLKCISLFTTSISYFIHFQHLLYSITCYVDKLSHHVNVHVTCERMSHGISGSGRGQHTSSSSSSGFHLDYKNRYLNKIWYYNRLILWFSALSSVLSILHCTRTEVLNIRITFNLWNKKKRLDRCPLWVQTNRL